MQCSVWLNLASRDLARSRKFYEEIGIDINVERSGSQMLGLYAGSNRVVINLFPEEVFKGFIGNAKAINSDEILISIGASNEAQVDEYVSRVVNAGGTIYSEPVHTGDSMYGFGFADPDGHKWNILYMGMDNCS